MPTSSNPNDARVGSQIGRSVRRLESCAKVTGRADYTHMMRLPGMLHAKLFGSTVAHGRIKSADLSDDAVGVRLTSLPLDPEALYRAIRKKAGCPLDDA